MTRRIAARALAIPLLVVLLAGFHSYRTLAHDQSSWGAGQPLGMFGRLDSHGSRELRVRAGDRAIPVAPELRDLAEHARVVPDEVATLARAIADREQETIEVTLVAHDGRVLRRETAAPSARSAGGR